MASKVFTATLLLLGSASAGPLVSNSAALLGRSVNIAISGAPASSLNAVQPPNQPNAVPSAETLAKLRTAEVGESFQEGNTVFINKGAVKTGSVGKRQECFTNSYQAVQVPSGQSGTWWGSWEPATGCFYTGDSGGNNANCQTVGASVTTSWTASAGFDLSTTDSVLGIINGDGSFNFGYTWGKSTSTSQSVNCCPGGDGVGQIWSQSQYGWSNSQTQTCYYDSCIENESCGAWSEYQHADWALPDGLRTIQYGCSTGSSNTQC